MKFHVFSFFFPSQAKRKSHLIFFFFFQFSIRGFQSLILILLKAKLSMHYLIVRDGTFISRGKLIIQWNFSFKNFFRLGIFMKFFFTLNEKKEGILNVILFRCSFGFALLIKKCEIQH